MSTDRTADVLGLIDGALDDWTTSADVMRWHPPVERPSLVGGTVPVHSTGGAQVGTGAVAEVRNGRPVLAFHIDFDAFVESMTRGLRAARGAIERRVEAGGPPLRAGDRIVIDRTALDGSDPEAYVVLAVRPDGSATLERVGNDGQPGGGDVQ